MGVPVGEVENHIFTGSGVCWSQILVWYSECTRSHVKCRGSISKSHRFPTPILDLEQESASVRLLVDNREAVGDKYATLSHCWGGRNILKLTRTNVASFVVGIPLESLPRTFLQAVEIARRLKIRYLWIDSLCIMQDVTGDWIREGSLMEKVYSCSYLNIM